MKSIIKKDDHIEISAPDCPSDRLYPCYQVYPNSCGVKLCHAKGEVTLKHEDFADQFASVDLMLGWLDTLNADYGCFQAGTTTIEPVDMEQFGIGVFTLCDSADDSLIHVICKKLEEDGSLSYTTTTYPGAIESVGIPATVTMCEKQCVEVGSKGTISNWSQIKI